MRYISTRGGAEALAFDDTVLAGLAPDGGLYLPETWPVLDLAALAGLDYAHLTAAVLAPFAAPAIEERTIEAICTEAYRGFGHADIAPVRPLKPGLWLLELFHGPTLAFKDFALQVLGRLFDHVLARKGQRITIVGATSGDTGSAAIEACRDRDAIEIFILHPRGRVSEVQRRQMTTVASANVHNIAVEGTFDDCQALVKAMFNDKAFRARHALSAVNSINWARIAAQIAYYVWAAVRLGAPAGGVVFAVPTGNFGNVFAAWAAGTVGVPIRRLIIGSNRNDILTRFFTTGEMKTGPVFPTLSPSMDIQISSNFERYLFELHDRDSATVRAMMTEFATTGRFRVDAAHFQRCRQSFAAFSLDDAATTAAIARHYRGSGVLLDPHSAIGVAAAEAALMGSDGAPVVAVATAHPAKFADAVHAATGVTPELPARLKDLFAREERYVTLPAELAAVERHIAATRAEREGTA
ncbi:MAG: threonine synthase [Defluviicoccus sp.]